MEGHAAMDMSLTSGGSWWQRSAITETVHLSVRPIHLRHWAFPASIRTAAAKLPAAWAGCRLDLAL
jgi:hypothetical protein